MDLLLQDQISLLARYLANKRPTLLAAGWLFKQRDSCLLGCTQDLVPVPKQAELGDVMGPKRGWRQKGGGFWMQAGWGRKREAVAGYNSPCRKTRKFRRKRNVYALSGTHSLPYI